MDSTMSGELGGPRSVPIEQLSVQDLSNLQQQLDRELGFFGESLHELAEARDKFKKSGEAVKALGNEENQQQAMVPLSESMYVRGSLSNVGKITVDIGTGYYAQMTVKQAVNYLKRKQKYLDKQIEQIQAILADKQRSKTIISEALQQKVKAALAQQQKS